MPNQPTSSPFLPNLLVIGAARSGTSAVHTFLAGHPDVFMTEPKEPHFIALGGRALPFQGPTDRERLDSVRTSNASAYRHLFDRSTGYQVRGDASVTTMYYPEASIPRIGEFCSPDVKLIALLREPAERAHSAYLYLRARGVEPITEFGAALDRETERIDHDWSHMWHYVNMSRYSRQLPAFVDAFGRDRLLVLLHDELETAPSATLGRIFDFLDLPPIDIDTNVKVNRSGEPRSSVLRRALRTARATPVVRAAAQRLTSLAWRDRVRANMLVRPSLDPKLAARLRDELHDDLHYVADLTDGRSERWLQG